VDRRLHGGLRRLMSVVGASPLLVVLFSLLLWLLGL
jgi:hypothetical protein